MKPTFSGCVLEITFRWLSPSGLCRYLPPWNTLEIRVCLKRADLTCLDTYHWSSRMSHWKQSLSNSKTNFLQSSVEPKGTCSVIDFFTPSLANCDYKYPTCDFFSGDCLASSSTLLHNNHSGSQWGSVNEWSQNQMPNQSKCFDWLSVAESSIFARVYQDFQMENNVIISRKNLTC